MLCLQQSSLNTLGKGSPKITCTSCCLNLAQVVNTIASMPSHPTASFLKDAAPFSTSIQGLQGGISTLTYRHDHTCRNTQGHRDLEQIYIHISFPNLMFINWVLIYTTRRIYLIQMCLYTVSMPRTTNEPSQEFRLALREERQLLQSMAKDAVLVKPPMEAVGKREGKMVTGTNRNMG